MAPSREEIDLYDAKMAAAMDAESPVAPTRKRRRSDLPPSSDGFDDSSDNDNDNDELPTVILPSGGASSGSSDGNMLVLAKHCATHKRLKPSQTTELEAFAGDSLVTRQIKLYAISLSIEGKLSSIVAATPEFSVSPSLDKNIRQLAYGIMTSVKISSYKGNITTAHLLNILKTQRFDLPLGIEFIASDWGRVKTRSEYQLTQCRATFKKFLKASMPSKASPAEHTNIFALGQRFVKDTQTVLTVELCARIALMRQRFILFPGDDFWDELDKRLVWMRKQANHDPAKIAKGFKLVLAEDREKHGNSADYQLPEDAIVDTWQLSVDDSIAADSVTV
ncbi:hypothetical protein C8F04DRAFT_1399395 [Mycena alexandri]|uniref:Uncharacterized protein n=1 Tax=Mycena alexandri TaxID=1745969 RepID=A0AAD6SII2_9AGAR|nr:hypothetical protein C8F04DRAFT_1399392 [Mycena alexandri]KAJ7027633.1 hypothetical protein C8F04DRAFT_1399395 [Mycena alexandri]